MDFRRSFTHRRALVVCLAAGLIGLMVIYHESKVPILPEAMSSKMSEVKSSFKFRIKPVWNTDTFNMYDVTSGYDIAHVHTQAKLSTNHPLGETTGNVKDKLNKRHEHVYNITEVENRFLKRNKHAEKVCSDPVYAGYKSAFERFRDLAGPNVPLKFCLVPKVGSTYMGALREKVFLQNNKTRPESNAETKYFMFTREPYSRLLSAYYNKLVTHPSWWNFTKYIITNFRPNSSEINDVKCGHDATFTEFLRYFIHSETTGERQDWHFMPVHRLCDPCHQHYDYSGRLETMRDDLRYIYGLVNESSEIHFEADIQTIQGTCSDFANLYVESGHTKCLSFCDWMKKVWLTFQARGILPEDVEFPVKQRDKCNKLTGAEFTDITMSVYNATVGTFDKHAQKYKFKRKMFAQVPLNIRMKVRDLLHREFDIFGYVSQPEHVFPELFN